MYKAIIFIIIFLLYVSMVHAEDTTAVINIIIENADVKYEIINSKDSLIKIDNISSTIFIKNNSINDKNSKTKVRIYDIKNDSVLTKIDLSKFIIANDGKLIDIEVPEERTFLEKYLEPTIAVISAAIITTLFFSVRSSQ